MKRLTEHERQVIAQAATPAAACAALPARARGTVYYAWQHMHPDTPRRPRSSSALLSPADHRRDHWTDTPAHRLLVARLLGRIRTICHRDGLAVDLGRVHAILEALRATSPSEWEDAGC